MAKRRSFGSIRAKGRRWETRYTAPDGRSHIRNFATKADASTYLALVEADMTRGQWTDPRLGRRTVADLADEWFNSKRNIRESTSYGYVLVLRNQIIPAFGKRKLGTITESDVENWLSNNIATGVSNTATVRSFRVFSQMMTFAVRRRYIPFNPCIAVTPPKEPVRDITVLEIAQVADLADAAELIYQPFSSIILLAAYSGLRWGECAGLETWDIAPVTNTVSVRQQLRPNLDLLPPKSAAGTRRVKIPGWLTERLQRTIETRAPSPKLDPKHVNLVFLTESGTPLANHNFNRRFWRPLVQDVLPERLWRFRFHDLRHTAVAIAIDSARRAGEPLNAKSLQVRMGHSQIQMTLQRYGHLLDGHDDGMVKGMVDPFKLRDSRRQGGTEGGPES